MSEGVNENRGVDRQKFGLIDGRAEDYEFPLQPRRPQITTKTFSGCSRPVNQATVNYVRRKPSRERFEEDRHEPFVQRKLIVRTRSTGVHKEVCRSDAGGRFMQQ